jgi:short-subunit dehydrogenase
MEEPVTSALGAAATSALDFGRRALIAGARRRRSRAQSIGSIDRSSEGLGLTALVTGASSGIGRATAELLAAKGYDVVIIARGGDRLRTLQHELAARYGVTVTPMICDLADPGSAEKISAFLDSEKLSIDFLVNNAGYTVIGHFADQPWDTHRDFVQTMALTPIELTWRLLPGMLERGYGRIVNVASVVALFAGSPQMVMYSPTKSMLHRFSEGLAAECEGLGVTCTTSIPGVTESEFFQRNNMQEVFDTKLSAQLWAMRPEVVAREIYAAAMSGRRVVIHGWHHRAALALLRHAPASIQYAAARGITGLSTATQ